MESPQNHFMITAQVEKRREKAGRPVHGRESARGPNAGLTQPNAETRGAGTSPAGKGGGHGGLDKFGKTHIGLHVCATFA